MPDEESFYSLRHYMDGKPFFKGKGFTFGLIACALNEWAMSREEAPRQTRSAPPVVSEEKIQKALALKAALLADLQASKLAPVALGGAK